MRRSAEQAEEDIWRKFGSKLRISGRHRSDYRLLIDGIRAPGMSIRSVPDRKGEIDEIEGRGSPLAIAPTGPRGDGA